MVLQGYSSSTPIWRPALCNPEPSMQPVHVTPPLCTNDYATTAHTCAPAAHNASWHGTQAPSSNSACWDSLIYKTVAATVCIHSLQALTPHSQGISRSCNALLYHILFFLVFFFTNANTCTLAYTHWICRHHRQWTKTRCKTGQFPGHHTCNNGTC